MKQYRYIDFDCAHCGSSCTRLVQFDTMSRQPVDSEICTEHVANDLGMNATCSHVLVAREMSGIGYMKTIVKGNDDFNERERERLEKRQDDHWKRQGRDEAIDREREFLKKQGAFGGVR